MKFGRKKRKTLVGSLALFGCLFVIFSLQGTLVGNKNIRDKEDDSRSFSLERVEGKYHHNRRLLQFGNPSSLANCTPPAVEQFPKLGFTKEQREGGWITLHVLVTAYMFLALAIACDDYFVPASEKICDALKLQSDVAGATFMAAGSSAPELATAVIGVFIAQDDIGLGAVVGSAVFNIMFVIAICALFAGAVVYLNWWPLFRDCFFYLISIIALALIIMDEFVWWYESLILLILYACYIIFMVFNARIEAWIVPKFTCCGYKKEEDLNELISIAKKGPSETTNGNTFEEEYNDNPASVKQVSEEEQHLTEEEEDGESVLSLPDHWAKRILWVISLPLTLVMFITIPDCRRRRWAKWWGLTFFMSIVWIAGFSYIMVWMITVIGFTFGIPDTIMGLTFIAAGASVPDAIASLLVCRDGYGDMAVSNAVGSNVFDILLCLGLPYFLKSVIVNKGGPVEVYSAGLTYSTLTLLSTVVFLLAATHINGWKLNKKYGVILLFVYVIFTVLASLYELNIFGYVHPPLCESNY